MSSYFSDFSKHPAHQILVVTTDHNYPKSHLQSYLLELQRFLHWENETKRLHDRKTEHFKALLNGDQSSAITDHVKTSGHNIKWDYFDILTSGKTDNHCSLFRSCSQRWMLMSTVKSFFFISKAFPLSQFTDSFCRLKRLKFLLQMFSV